MKKTKYFAKSKIVDGIKFSSIHEADRYCELKALQKFGKIRNLQLQVPFIIIPTQFEEITTYTPKRGKEKKTKKVVEKMAKYIADFTYETTQGEFVVEDAKGYKDSIAYALFVLKRKLMLQVYGIKVKEV